MKRSALLVLEILLIVGLGVWVYLSLTETSPIKRPGGVEVTVQLPGARDKAILYKDEAGHHRYAITEEPGGEVIDLSADELASRVLRGRTERSWGQKVLNVSSPIGY